MKTKYVEPKPYINKDMEKAFKAAEKKQKKQAKKDGKKK